METLRRALILAPMSSELRPVVKLAKAHRTTVDDLTAYAGQVGEVDVVICQLGVGPARARTVTEQALACLQVDHVLVTGIAGGLHPDLIVGALVVPEVILDVASGQRYHSAAMEGVERKELVATTDQLITDEQRLAELQRLGVVALEMESSGVAVACEAAGVPWTTFRVISDRPDQHLLADDMMALLRPDGTADVGAAVGQMVRHPRRIPGMLQLGRDASMAASKAARITLAALGWVA